MGGSHCAVLFALAPTGVLPGCQTVPSCPRNEIELFSNLPAARLAPLHEPRKKA